MADKDQKTEDKEDQEDKEGKKDESSKSSQSTESLKPQVKVGKKLEGIIKDIEELSVLELSELVKALEEKFGVTAAVPMAAATPWSAPAAGGGETANEAKTKLEAAGAKVELK